MPSRLKNFLPPLAELPAVIVPTLGASHDLGALLRDQAHVIAGIPTWLDSFYNAAMILGATGPVSEIHSAAGKIFASFYALFSGVFLIASVGYFLTPVLHRLVHRFHLEEDS